MKVSERLHNDTYAPGIPTYGIKGKTGDQGEPGVSLFFTDYTIDEIVWERPDYNKAYFDDVYVITGHTPTQYIEDNDRPGYIYRKNNHIAIDCGACSMTGRLAAICLDNDEEYYVDQLVQP